MTSLDASTTTANSALLLRGLGSRMRGLGSRTYARLRRAFRPVLALGLAAVATIALRRSGTLSDTDTTFQLMGFDPDRARLLTALTAEAIVVVLATIVTRARLSAWVAGIGVGGALFARTFIRETQAAMQTSGPQGTFDPGGWVVTAITLAVSLAIVAWAAVSLAQIVRGFLLATAADTAAFVRGDRVPRRVGRPMGTVVVAVLLFVALPVFGDMVNFSPDVHMRTGQQGTVGLTDTTTGASPTARPAVPSSSGGGSVLLPGASGPAAPGTTTGNPVLLATRPWQAWTPTGSGTVVDVQLPGPWVGGATSPASLSIYLPAGYASSTRSYPVIYEAPWSLGGGWTRAVHATSTLDSLIGSGAIPPSIAVFIAQGGGPYTFSECVDSVDHQEWFERYITDTVIPYVDQHYRTIATPAARAVMGFSDGGFCSTMLVLRHPDLFSTAISFSGYYQAGIRSGQTPQAWRPFGGDAAFIAAHSPVVLASQVPSAARSSLLFILSANATEPFYGPQYQAFAAALHGAKINVDFFPTPVGHAWASPRDQLPGVLQALAQRWNALKVFA